MRCNQMDNLIVHWFHGDFSLNLEKSTHIWIVEPLNEINKSLELYEMYRLHSIEL